LREAELLDEDILGCGDHRSAAARLLGQTRALSGNCCGCTWPRAGACGHRAGEHRLRQRLEILSTKAEGLEGMAPSCMPSMLESLKRPVWAGAQAREDRHLKPSRPTGPACWRR
jgi:hypothetical protein